MGVSRSQQSTQASALTAAPNSQTSRLAGRQLDERLAEREIRRLTLRCAILSAF